MKKFFVLILTVAAVSFFCSAPAFSKSGYPAKEKASAKPKDTAVISGKVVETMDSGGYTYVKLQNDAGETLWLAMPETKVKVGETAAFNSGPVLQNFKSDTLKRTFDRIIFTDGPAVLPGAPGAKGDKSKKTAKASQKINLEKAAGADAHTVAEVYKEKSSISGKKVSVRGKVVKLSMNIMGNNWLHIQDGTGSAEKGTNELIVTTKDKASVGDIVTATGIIATDKDFGYGYKYDLIMEQSAIQK